ncbi:hypothetical protein QYF61_023056 [Mycteria americana]|uniref:Rna-directed dna polymerase from mobile element jockey-like n=1 Tax=Mycteria americana TaxID=33587 RepID=A0AAN7P0B0_MYCAM|nr:hypothetical protein QYF61_023056 [Mycteria americana]
MSWSLHDRTESVLGRFADDTKLGGAADTPGGRAAVQRDLARLEKWAGGNLTQLNKEKCEVLGTAPGTRTGWRPPARCFAGKNLGVLVDTGLTMSQQRALAQRTRMASGPHEAKRCRSREGILPLCGVLGPVLGSPARRGQTGESPARTEAMIEALKHLSHEERLRALGSNQCVYITGGKK